MSLQKDLEEDIMVYASYSTGFKSGGFNATSEDSSWLRELLIKDEESTNFEVGINRLLIMVKRKLMQLFLIWKQKIYKVLSSLILEQAQLYITPLYLQKDLV